MAAPGRSDRLVLILDPATRMLTGYCRGPGPDGRCSLNGGTEVPCGDQRIVAAHGTDADGMSFTVLGRVYPHCPIAWLCPELTRERAEKA